jgi:hypothetical protein
MIFTAEDYAKLHTLFDLEGYAGYKPDVVESPNGDGALDEGKRYLHVALKYDPPEWALSYLARAHFEACRIAEIMGVSDEFYPRVENATLRVLDYPVNCGTEPHTDFDLFTIDCYGSLGTACEYKCPDGVWREEDPPYKRWHLGEIGEIIGLGKADEHRVLPVSEPRQSIVYFAMPDMHSDLPVNIDGVNDSCSVQSWLDERYARSRTYK